MVGAVDPHQATLQRPTFRAETAEDLRELLTQAELIVANLRGAGPRAETLLHLLDAIDGLMSRLATTGLDLRAEATRLETVERQLLSRDSVLLSELARLGGLAKVREAARPPEAAWWWYLDRRVAERQKARLRRGLWMGGGVSLVLLAAFLLYRLVFPPDPRAVVALDKASQAEQAVRKGDLAGALVLYRQAAETMPEEPRWQVWVGVLEEQQGQLDAAARAYAGAEQAAGGRVPFLVLRGMAWLELNAWDKAAADAESALTTNPDCAEAYFVLGSAFEAAGERAKAVAAFERAAELAANANNSTLVVMAKTRLGMLLQAPVVPASGTGTGTP